MATKEQQENAHLLAYLEEYHRLIAEFQLLDVKELEPYKQALDELQKQVENWIPELKSAQTEQH